MMKILVVGPSWIGDMVMSQSLFKRLKLLNPNCQIDVLAPQWCEPILGRMPEVSKAITMPVGHGEFKLSKRWKLARELKDKGYTNAIVLPNSAKSSLIPLFAGIPKRTGWKGEFRYGLLNDLRPDRSIFQYMVERYVALAHSKDMMTDEVKLESIEYPRLEIDPLKQEEAIHRLNLTTNKPIIGLCPGAEFGPAKRWPDDHYATVATKLIEKGNNIWIFGSQKDSDIANNIISKIPEELKSSCVNLTGKTSLIEAVDLIAICQTVISNDSGLMHVAASVGCDIIAIYGSTSPNYTPPLSNHVQIVSTDIECRPCFKRTCPKKHLKCLKDIKPEMVLENFKLQRYKRRTNHIL